MDWDWTSRRGFTCTLGLRAPPPIAEALSPTASYKSPAFNSPFKPGSFGYYYNGFGFQTVLYKVSDLFQEAKAGAGSGGS